MDLKNLRDLDDHNLFFLYVAWLLPPVAIGVALPFENLLGLSS